MSAGGQDARATDLFNSIIQPIDLLASLLRITGILLEGKLLIADSSV